MPENIWTVTTVSFDALREVASAIDETNGQAQTPCTEWNVIQVLQHAIGDQLAWAASLGVGSGPSENPFEPSGRLDGTVTDLVDPALSIAGTAWTRAKSDDGMLPTPLPQGALPANIAAGACALDAAVHAWDIAIALDRPSPLTPQLAAEVLPAARAVVEPLREYGAYGPALPSRPKDDSVVELLRYLGRDPKWSVRG
jgi:uncharacterized protein (TIGR03086 family)